MADFPGQNTNTNYYPKRQDLYQQKPMSLTEYKQAGTNANSGSAFRGGPIISIVIPAMNEAENLPHVLPQIPAWVDEVLLVDGHSTDDTVQVARQLYPRIRIIQQSGRGKGNALRCGFEAATGDIIVMLDADGSMRPGEIGDFVSALLLGADFAKGSRFINGGGTADMEWYRQLGNWGFVVLARLGFGCQFSDLCYGYNAFWRHALSAMNLQANGFEIETEMNLRAHTSGLSVVEIPSFEDPRIYGTSNLNTFADGWRVLKTMFSEWSRTGLKNSSPVYPAGIVKGRSPRNLRSAWLELHPNISVSELKAEALKIIYSSLNSLDATTSSLIMVDDNGNISHASLWFDGQIQELKRFQVIDTVRSGLAGWVMKNQQAALVENTCDDPRWLNRSWDDRGCSSRSAISVPLVSTGQISGALTLVKNTGKTFNRYDLLDLVNMKGQIQPALSIS